MITVEELIEMKNQEMSPFSNKYVWLILTIEDSLIAKSNPEARINQLLKQYNFDDKAKLMIVHQFFKVGHQSAEELYNIFGFENYTEEQTFLEDKYANELLDKF